MLSADVDIQKRGSLNNASKNLIDTTTLKNNFYYFVKLNMPVLYKSAVLL
jgi:hypothetical protein